MYIEKKVKKIGGQAYGVRIFIFHLNLNKCDTCTHSVGF